MKYFVMLFLIFITFLYSSCENFLYEDYYYEWDFPEEISSERDITNILQRPKYNYRYDINDEWNYPHETYYNETVGCDCEDMAILAAYLYSRELNKDNVYLVGLKNKYNENNYHMIWRVGNKYYESTGNKRGEIFLDWEEYSLYKEWKFNDFMDYMHNNGRSITDINFN
jgi:hypothetical protein